MAFLMLMDTGCGHNGVGPLNPPDTAWTYLGLGNETVTSIAIDPANSNIIYVGSIYDYSAGKVGKLFKSTNAGKTWNMIAKGGGYSQLLIDPEHPQTIYAAPGTILKSTNGGKTWQESDTGIRLDYEHRVVPMAMDPSNPGILYAGTGGLFGGGLYKTTDAGKSWNQIGSDSLTGGVASIDIDPHNSNIIYAGTASAGILWMSTDAGRHWVRTGLGETGLIIESIFVDSKELYAGLSSNNGPYDIDPYYGIWRSENGGGNWKNYNQGLPQGSGVMNIVAQNNSQTLYMTMSFPNPSPTPTVDSLGGVYERKSTAGSWTKIGIDTLYDFYSSSMTISPNGKYLYFGNKGVYRLKLK